ncbi:cystine/glutamate transporter-like [Rhinatrema bivittatum]|uniref:cystine/glutamate transporter-like n=1 Tax=Rhinatrema bivittatum TaxID=194408 RepID=UPI0011290F2B|nr:cystine/glutamate transporter-like [Rhinatrema bivittatum]
MHTSPALKIEAKVSDKRMARQLKKDGETVFLRKKFTLLRAISMIISTMVGSGIFISPKGVLQNTGSVGLSLVVWLACGFLSMLGALCYAELGTSITKSGGHYVYLLETLGSLPAFLYLWAEFFAVGPANLAVLALAFGRYIWEPFFTPCSAPILAVKLTSVFGFCTVTALNSWSVSWSAKLQTFLSVIKLTALALIIVPGMILLKEGHTENFQGAFDSSTVALDRLSVAFYPGMFAYSGWFQVSYFREEVVNPERNIPLAVIISVVTVIIGYLLTNVSYYTVLTTESVLASEAVAVSFAEQAFKGLASVLPVLVALSCLGTLNSGSFGASRTLFVASREGYWPKIFSMINIQRNTPLPAVLLYVPMVIVLISIGDIFYLLNFMGFSRWLFIGLATLGLIVHRYRHPELPRPFKVPLVISVAFTAICVFTVGISVYSAPDSVGFGCLAVLTGLPIYYLIVYRAKSTCCSAISNYITLNLQILLQAVPQEICTY